MSQEEKTKSELEGESFRENLATAEESGKRKWVFPRKTHGKYTTYRNIVSAILLILLFVIPFIKTSKGNPFFQFDFLNRQFYLFGAYFSPSDFYLFSIGFVTTIVFIILFTVVYGRIFCGWICPQTIFMEHVFRKIEYLIEGDRNKQIRLDKQDWDSEKIRKRLLKWTIFALISFIFSNILFSYIFGIDEMIKMIKEGPANNVGLFVALIIFSALFYLVFAWFREQVCSFVCPYGRLQGVLIDKDTINITYDFIRGEGEKGRSKWKKNEDRKLAGKGDCIDCQQCVVVCPAGIDIRNGSQLECINCTACIDACDEVMTKVGLPTGLIRYASENMIEKRTTFKFNARVIAYTLILFILIAVCTSLLFVRSSVESKFLKVVGTQFTIQDKNIVDEYQFSFINKTSEIQNLNIKIISPKSAEIELVGYGNKITIKPKELLKGTAVIKIPEADLSKTKQEVVIGVFDNKGAKIDEYKTNFIGPTKELF